MKTTNALVALHRGCSATAWSLIVFTVANINVAQAQDTLQYAPDNQWQVVGSQFYPQPNFQPELHSSSSSSTPESTILPPSSVRSVDQQGWFRTAPDTRPQTLVPTIQTNAVPIASAVTRQLQAPVQPITSSTSRLTEPPAKPIWGRQSGTLPPGPSGASSDKANTLNTTRLAGDSRSSHWQPQTINLDLFVGEVRVMGPVDTARVAVGNGSIVDVKVIESNELLIIATAPGSTSLRLWNRDASQTDFNIRVSETDPQTRVRIEPMVRMRVRMVEFRKSALGRLGIDWGDSAAGPTLAAAGATASRSAFSPIIEGSAGLPAANAPFSTYFGITSNIASRINFLAQNGDAVTLAEPVLSAMNGGEASFLAGGEVPYPTVGQNGQTQVEFKDYGVKLNVAPLIDNAGNVRAKLETEISQLDSSVSVQGAPGLLTRRAQTEVTVRSGETIVISGLLSTESSGDVDMIPGIGRLPIIGKLFSSKAKRNSVSELVIFVTPEVVYPQAPMIDAREQLYLEQSTQRLADMRRRLPIQP